MWSLLADGETATWDTCLPEHENYNVYQTVGWGRYKQQRGWHPRHLRVDSEGRSIAMLQALVRAYPLRTVLAWCPGGPVGAIQTCSAEMMRCLARQLGARALYCRATFLQLKTDADTEFLLSQGWRRPEVPVSANETAVWDLSASEEALIAGLNRNWRYSLRQAHRRGCVPRLLAEIPAQEMAELSGAMYATKDVSLAVREAELGVLFGELGSNAIAYGCRNAEGRLISFHSCAVIGQRAWELVAATSEEGRQVGASFASLWALVLHCRQIGVTHYDLAGVDYKNALGVSKFKLWTGAGRIERLGEWEWTTSRLLSWAVAVAARNREASGLP